jgi:hypothetical protein
MFGSLRRHGGTIVVAGIVGAVAASGPAVAGQIVAFAQSAGNANTVNKIGASKTPRAGMLLPLNARGQYPAGVVPAGRQGAAGPAGTQGPQGLQGAPGPAGATGGAGAQGSKGATGAAGNDGLPGLPGAPGDQGIQGVKGDTGTPGADGTNGTNGAKGDTGDRGDQGIQGVKGDTGTAGADGTNGTNGLKGDKGDKGDTGGLILSPIVDVDPKARAADEHLWGDVVLNGGEWNSAFRGSNPGGDDTSYVEFNLPLAAGTWDMEVTYAVSTDAGVMTFTLDGTAIGAPIDAYATAVGLDRQATFSSITVPTSGIYKLRVRTATKNADSLGYFGYLHWLRLVKQ